MISCQVKWLGDAIFLERVGEIEGKIGVFDCDFKGISCELYIEKI